MSDSFDSFESFANHLSMVVVPNIPSAMREGLHEVGEVITASAQAKFGEYQPAVYKFPKWAPLSEATIESGNPNNTPLLRTGETRDSVDYTIDGDNVVIGSSEPTMVYHEVGTKTEPPRPVLGPAAYEARAMIRQIMGKATVLAVVPGMKLSKSLGFKRTGPRIASDIYNRYRGTEG